MKLKGSTYFLLLLLLIALVVIYLSLSITTEYKLVPAMARAGLIPLAVASFMTLFCVIALFQELRKKPAKERPARGIGGRPIGGGEISFRWDTVIWLIAFMPVVVLIGFVLATLVWIVVYLKTHEVGWVRSIVMGLVTAIFVYVLFIGVMDLRLYEGVLPIYRYLIPAIIR